MSIELNDFILNLKQFRNDPIKIYKNQIKDIIAGMFREIASYTITDTGEARRKVLEIVSKISKGQISDLQETAYNYWSKKYGTPQRSWGNNLQDVNINQNIGKENFSLDVNINDDGLYAQENAINGVYERSKYPSEEHAMNTGRDNSKYMTRHITYVADLINKNNFDELSELDYNKLINDICEYIEKHLFK